jgi:hypothetical protein
VVKRGCAGCAWLWWLWQNRVCGCGWGCGGASVNGVRCVCGGGGMKITVARWEWRRRRGCHGGSALDLHPSPYHGVPCVCACVCAHAGYPNVGKSSVINTLVKKKSCKVAPIPGETKVWQYITLMKRIFLIDCPGIVFPTGATETELVLKGVVRSEKLSAPSVRSVAVYLCVASCVCHLRGRLEYTCSVCVLTPPHGTECHCVSPCRFVVPPGFHTSHSGPCEEGVHHRHVRH